MRKHIIFFIFFFSSVNTLANAADFVYPKAEKSDQKDVYFGTEIADPYRWMENNDDARLEPWIEAENKVTQAYLEKLPFREKLRARLTELVNYPKYSIPWTRHAREGGGSGRTFYSKNDGLQNQSVLYVLDKPDSEPRVLLDPNTLSADGTISVGTYVVSRDGKHLAYTLSQSGSDWSEIHVLDIATGEKMSDQLKWIKFSRIAWAGTGFYYSRYPTPTPGQELTAKNELHKVYYHKLGTTQDQDELIYEDNDHPQRTIRAATDREERFLFIMASESTYGNNLLFKDLKKNNAPLQTIVATFDSEFDVVSVVNDKIYIHTDKNASNQKLIAVDPTKPQPEHWADVIPESDSLLNSVRNIGGKLVVTYLKDAASDAYIYNYEGKREKPIELPTIGVCGFSGEPDQDVYYQSFTSYTYPTVIYKCNMRTGERSELFPSAAKFEPSQYETKRIWYTNSAGRKAPIFVVHKKDLVLDGNNPTLLYGYGGFNISMSPSFSALRIPFLENGGVYAVAILRGGGEYGEEWYKSGTLLQKRNVFDDFAVAAKQLIADKYTSSRKIAIQGGSNGGLLVGASMMLYPDLYRAAHASVGVLDMLRYQKFTIGWAWANDYGTAEQNEEMFRYLLSYSPLHNVKPGVDYPAVLITTSDHDDRVVPAHSFKFAATLQEKSTSKYPGYIRIETKAGHGAGKPISKVIEEQTDIWSFLMDQLGMTFQ